MKIGTAVERWRTNDLNTEDRSPLPPRTLPLVVPSLSAELYISSDDYYQLGRVLDFLTFHGVIVQDVNVHNHQTGPQTALGLPGSRPGRLESSVVVPSLVSFHIAVGSEHCPISLDWVAKIFNTNQTSLQEVHLVVNKYGGFRLGPRIWRSNWSDALPSVAPGNFYTWPAATITKYKAVITRNGVRKLSFEANQGGSARLSDSSRAIQPRLGHLCEQRRAFADPSSFLATFRLFLRSHHPTRSHHPSQLPRSYARLARSCWRLARSPSLPRPRALSSFRDTPVSHAHAHYPSPFSTFVLGRYHLRLFLPHLSRPPRPQVVAHSLPDRSKSRLLLRRLLRPTEEGSPSHLPSRRSRRRIPSVLENRRRSESSEIRKTRRGNERSLPVGRWNLRREAQNRTSNRRTRSFPLWTFRSRPRKEGRRRSNRDDQGNNG